MHTPNVPVLVHLLVDANPECASIGALAGALAGRRIPRMCQYWCTCWWTHIPNVPVLVHLLVDAYPEGASIADGCWNLPLHYAAASASLDILKMMLDTYPAVIHQIYAVSGEEADIDYDAVAVTPFFNALMSSNPASGTLIVEYICGGQFPFAAAYIVPGSELTAINRYYNNSYIFDLCIY